MDSEDLQTTPSQTEPETPASSGTQIFDISDDSISPISAEALAESSVQPSKPLRTTTRLGENSDKQTVVPPDKELLDKNIGSFDMTPFGKSQPTPTPQSVRPAPQRPSTPPSYREHIQPSDLVREGSVPSIPSTPATKLTPTAPRPSPILQPSNPTPRPSLQDEIARTVGDQMGMKSPVQRPSTPTPITPTPPPSPKTQPPPLTTVPQAVIKPVRTYEGDVAEAMSHRRTSSASIAIAESEKQQGSASIANEPPSHAGRKAMMFILALVLLGGGAYGAYYLYLKSALAPVAPVVQQQKAAPSVIPSDKQRIIPLTNQTARAVQTAMLRELNASQEPNTITEYIIATKDTAGTLTRIPAQTMIAGLDINAPDILTRSLTPRWMLGTYTDPDGITSTFVVVTSDFFQNTFAGMLQWEPLIADDIRQFLYPSTIEGISNEAGTPAIAATATSTPETVSTTTETVQPLRPYSVVRGKFEDRIVKNRDVRAFRTDAGKILFLYSFIDNTRLVITDRESTLGELLNRLEKQSYIR